MWVEKGYEHLGLPGFVRFFLDRAEKRKVIEERLFPLSPIKSYAKLPI